MSNLTLAPNPWFTGFDDDGNIVPGGKLFTYAAGTSTKKNTYTDVLGLVANTNPIILDDAGRVPSGLFLLPSSYKFILSPADDTDPPTNPIRSQDNIGAVPTTDIDNDVTGTAGEAMLASEAAYLSDGSGGLIAGRWYKADADLTYASTAPEIAFVVSDVAAAATGTFRLSGRVTGLSGLTPGANYYISATAGAITATAPVNVRFVGQADSITSLIATPNPPINTATSAIIDPKLKTLCNGRLSLTTGEPVTIADVTAATSVFWVPYQGNEVALYSGASWVTFAQAQLSVAVPATTATMYDVWMDYNAGVPALSVTAWTNDTTRATALTKQDGVYVKSGAATSRYLGSFRTTGVSGQTEDSFAKRYLWNYYNRVPRTMRVLPTTDSWTYTTATLRQANASTANQLDCVIGVAEVELVADVFVGASNDTGGATVLVSIGQDSTTTAMTGVRMLPATINAAIATNVLTVMSSVRTYPAIGRHFYAWLEYSTAAGTTTWYGDNGNPTLIQGGIAGMVWG